MLRRILAVLALATGPFAAAQTPEPAAQAGETARGAPVLRVDGEDVSQEEYARWLLDNFGARLATTFAGDYLVEREARRRGVSVEPAEVAAELERELATRIEGAFAGSKEGWLAELARTQRTEDGLRAQRAQELGVELLTKKTVAVDRVVPEEKIVREWELSYGRGGRAYELSMLLVRCEFLTPEASADRATAERLRQEEFDKRRARALALRERIERSGDFAAVAREASEDPETRLHGGRLAHTFRQFGWPKAFLDELDALAPGELSAPLYAKGGYWIVRVESVRSTPLESVRGELVARLEARGPEQDETGTFRNTLVEAARIEVLPTIFGEPGGDVEQALLLPALSVDGEVVSRGAYARWIQRTRGEASWPHFVEHRVVFDEARRRGVEATDAEVRARSEEYVRRLILELHEGSREAWIASLKLKGRDVLLFMHDLDVRMRIELLCERLILLDRAVSPEAVRARFEDLYGKDGVATRVRLLLVNTKLAAGPAGETREQLMQRQVEAQEAARNKARSLAAAVRDGADFAALARRHSEDPVSAPHGGTLEGRFRPETWPESIAKTVQALPTGAVTDALEYGPCWVVLQVTARDAVRFDEVREDLARQMQSEPPPRPELNLYRNTLVRRAKVELASGMHR